MINIQKLKTQIINSQLAKDSFWAIFGNVVGKGLSMIAMIIIARILGKNDYGEYGMGYIGTAAAYDQGGYETSKMASNVAPEAEKSLMKAIREVLK